MTFKKKKNILQNDKKNYYTDSKLFNGIVYNATKAFYFR